MPVPRLLETLPATDCILHRQRDHEGQSSCKPFYGRRWAVTPNLTMNPGQDFSIGALGGEERLFRFQCKGWVVRELVWVADKCMKDMAEKTFRKRSLKKLSSACGAEGCGIRDSACRDLEVDLA